MAAVPRYAQITAGTAVQIVLKQDQRSGRLTSGQVADVLTRGDHPRGIKVRLTDGKIGRVQSLGSQAKYHDARQDEAAHHKPAVSLADFVRPAAKGKQGDQEGMQLKQLEREFPQVDSALIASIQHDHPDNLDRTREILSQIAPWDE